MKKLRVRERKQLTWLTQCETIQPRARSLTSSLTHPINKKTLSFIMFISTYVYTIYFT